MLKKEDTISISLTIKRKFKKFKLIYYTEQGLHSAGAAERSNPTSKVRSSDCALLEQP